MFSCKINYYFIHHIHTVAGENCICELDVKRRPAHTSNAAMKIREDHLKGEGGSIVSSSSHLVYIHNHTQYLASNYIHTAHIYLYYTHRTPSPLHILYPYPSL
ncbi:hypothetical protein EON63_01840 [archaeon]|nr:MAG: hypothetical protein EON63_01840 [archaeon]